MYIHGKFVLLRHRTKDEEQWVNVDTITKIKQGTFPDGQNVLEIHTVSGEAYILHLLTKNDAVVKIKEISSAIKK